MTKVEHTADARVLVGIDISKHGRVANAVEILCQRAPSM